MSSGTNVTLRQLRYFALAAETGQISKAASEAHVTQSAITTAVLLLEDSVGVRLLERNPQGVLLTAEGHNFYQHARHILDSLSDALREPRFQAHNLKGVIRVAASYAVLGYFLPPLLARFRAHYPDVEIDLHDMNRLEVEKSVAKGEIELGIIILSNSGNQDNFGSHVLMRSRRQLWASSSHPLLEKAHASLEDIARYPYIQLTVDEGESSTVKYWKVQELEPNIAFRTTSMEALRGLIAHGFGITILSDMVYRPWSLEGKKIEARPILDAVPHMEVGMIWNPDRAMASPMNAFKQFLIHTCGS